jgi:hypothetical protein
VLFPGFVTGIRLAGALVYDITLGETRRREQSDAFRAASAAFPNISAMIGGPVRQSWARLAPKGGWRFKFQGTSGTGANGYVALRFVRGVLASNNHEYSGSLKPGAIDELHRWAVPYYVESNNWFAAIAAAGYFPRLEARVETTAGVLVGTFTPIAVPNSWNTIVAAVADSSHFVGYDYIIRPETQSLYLWWGTGGTFPAQPSSGTEYHVFVYPTEVSASNPLHIDLHPVDVLTGLWSDAGIAYDASAATTAKQAIGTDVRLLARITGPEKLADFAQRAITGPFGLATRVDSTGQMVVFASRVKVAGAPGTTISVNELRQGDDGLPIGGPVFELEEATMVNSVVVEEDRYRDWQDGDGDRAIDSIVPVRQRGAPAYLSSDGSTFDYATVGLREVAFAIPGTVRTSAAAIDPTVFAAGIAQEIFDRYGAGAIVTELACTTAVAAINLGDEVIVNVPHLPNNNVRGGNRIMQVVRRTPVVDGYDLRLVDAGTSAQPATAPTFTVAATTGNLKKSVTITVTNAATLAAAGYNARVEWYIGSASPTGNGALLRTFTPADLAAGWAISARVDAGSLVAVQMRSEKPGFRPSAYTAWASVNLTDLVAPGSLALSGTPTDPARPLFTWTLTETDTPLEFYVRLASESSSAARLVHTLPAGSTQYQPQLMSATDAVVVGVRHREVPPFAGVSTTTELTYTPGVTGLTLSPPTNPSAFAGRVDDDGVPVLDGTFGLEVDAAETPGFVEFSVAAETSAGSGTPGTYTSGVPVPAAQGTRTRWTAVAPNDGLLRYLRARSSRSGTTESSYTAEVSIAPWSPTPPVLRSTVTTTATAVAAATPRIDVAVSSSARGIIRLYRNAGSAASALAAQLIATSDAGSASLAHASTGLVAATVYHYYAVVTDVVTGATSADLTAARSSATFPSAGAAASVSAAALSGAAITNGAGGGSASLTVSYSHSGASGTDLLKIDVARDGRTWVNKYSAVASTGSVSSSQSFSMTETTWGDLFCRVRLTDSTGVTTLALLVTSESSYYRG